MKRPQLPRQYRSINEPRNLFEETQQTTPANIIQAITVLASNQLAAQRARECEKTDAHCNLKVRDLIKQFGP